MRFKVRLLGVALIAFLAGCYNQPAPPTKIIKFKSINVSGTVTKVSFNENGYCYELALPKGSSVPLCKAKHHYNKGDVISYSQDANGIVKTKLLKQAQNKKSPILRKAQPKKSKISTPKNEIISFD